MAQVFCVVVQTGDYKERNFDDLSAAERFARRVIEDRDKGKGTTWCSIVRTGKSSWACTEVIAHVRADALGRVWTDFMPGLDAPNPRWERAPTMETVA